MATGDERIYTRINPDKLSDDAIDDYAEELWRALTTRLGGDPCL